MATEEVCYVDITLQNSRMAGVNNSCVLASDGELYFFGDQQADFSNKVSRCYPGTLVKMKHYFSSKVMQVCVGNSFIVFLTEENKVYGCGSNQFCQLGFKNENNVMNFDRVVPQEIPIHWIDGETRIKKISAGTSSTMVLTYSGTVYSCGQFSGRVPVTNETVETYDYALCAIASEVFHSDPVVDLCSGCCVSIFITSSGSVYSVGCNSNSEGNHILGHTDIPAGNSINIPHRLSYFCDNNVRAVRGSVGRLHAVIVDDRGLLHGWGSNRCGQLGLPELSDFTARHIEILSTGGQPVTFQQVDCGSNFTLALSTDGQAWSFGSHSCGALGRSESMTEFTHLPPGKVELECEVAAVYAGWYHSLFVTTQLVGDSKAGDKPVYGRVIASCGHGVNFQLGGGELTVVKGRSEGRIIPEIVNLSSDAPPPVRTAVEPAAPVQPRGAVVRKDVFGKRGWNERATAPVTKRNRQHNYNNDSDGGESDNDRDVNDDDEEEDEDNGYGEYDERSNSDDSNNSDEGEDGEQQRGGADEDGGDGSNGGDGGDDDEEGEEAEDEEDGEDVVDVMLDFGDVPISQDNGPNPVLQTLNTFAERLFVHPDYLSAEEDSLLHVTIANHYQLADIQHLTASLTDPQVLDVLRDRLQGFTFVSCGIFAEGLASITAFAQALALYPQFVCFTLDLTNIYTDLAAAASEEEEDRPHGQLAAALVSHVPNLKSLVLPSVGDESMELLCDSLANNGNDPAVPPRSALSSLTIESPCFSIFGFECLANVLSTNSVLQELILPEHATISDESAIILAQSLTTNSTLERLDLRLRELGHEGVQQLGIEALLQCMESNPRCVLSYLDVSGDDGVPTIDADLQRRLTACLVRNAKRNHNKYLRHAKMTVDTRHIEDDY